MTDSRDRFKLKIRSVVVSFDSAARTLAFLGDESTLRAAHDQAQLMLDSLNDDHDPDRRSQLFEARDALMRIHRHHLEACDAGEEEAAPVGTPDSNS